MQDQPPLWIALPLVGLVLLRGDEIRARVRFAPLREHEPLLLSIPPGVHTEAVEILLGARFLWFAGHPALDGARLGEPSALSPPGAPVPFAAPEDAYLAPLHPPGLP